MHHPWALCTIYFGVFLSRVIALICQKLKSTRIHNCNQLTHLHFEPCNQLTNNELQSFNL